MNNIRKIKLCYKEAQRKHDKEENIWIEKLNYYFSKELNSLGFNGHCYKDIITDLNKLPSSTVRSIFRVGRAVKRKGEHINLSTLLLLLKGYTFGTYYFNFERSITEKNPYGDLRLFPTDKEIDIYMTTQETKNTTLLRTQLKFKLQVNYNTQTGKYELFCPTRTGKKLKVIAELDKETVNELIK